MIVVLLVVVVLSIVVGAVAGGFFYYKQFHSKGRYIITQSIEIGDNDIKKQDTDSSTTSETADDDTNV